jgi:hypothetical protein
MSGFSLGRRGIFGMLLLVAVLVVGVAVSRVSATPQPTSTPGRVSAIAACHLPDTAEEANGTLVFGWQLAVRVDAPQVSVLFFTSGSDSLLCEAWRGTDGNYGSSTTTAIGRFVPRYGAALTYDGGSEPATGDTWPSQLVIGQAPRSSASIEVVTADGEQHDATIGNGFYLAWVSAGNRPSEVVEIVARDSAGAIIAHLADPSGLQPGASAAPASS